MGASGDKSAANGAAAKELRRTSQPEVASESVELEAKERSAAVVLAWRDVDWAALEQGQPAALSALRLASEGHESTRRFLLDEAGELGQRLDAGLERFFAQHVGPQLRRPAVLAALAAVEAPASADRTADEGGSLVPRARPSVTVGHTVRMNTGCGNLYVTVNESTDGSPFELFNHMGKAGGCAASQNEAIGRLISYALRCGASLEPLIKQLKGISCHRPAWGEDGKISSCSDAIGKALEKYSVARRARLGPETGRQQPSAGAAAGSRRAEHALDFAERSAGSEHEVESNGHATAAPGRLDMTKVQGACPDCGSQLSFEEGCVKCHSCGFTECG